jgi:uncharacterized protein
MKINVSSVSRSIDSSMKVSGDVNIPQISYGSEDIDIVSPIVVDGMITNTGGQLIIKGTIKAKLLLKCSRCLEKFEYNLVTSFEEELSNEENEEDVIFVEGDILDMTDIVVNNILLSLPMKFVCSENCKGLCPKCGRNINIHECSCVDENLDPRLAVLKDLLRDK